MTLLQWLLPWLILFTLQDGGTFVTAIERRDCEAVLVRLAKREEVKVRIDDGEWRVVVAAECLEPRIVSEVPL